MDARKAQHLVDIGVDYITGTCTDSVTSQILLSLAYKLHRDEASAGGLDKPWSMAGYSGVKCGRLQYGERHDGAIIRLSSELAQWEWFEVYQRSDNITRIDVQFTLRCELTPAAVVDECYRDALRFSMHRQNKLSVTRWEANDGGCTVYLGKRASEKFARIYNKHSESNDEKWLGCVRYELELKGDSARIVARDLASGCEVLPAIAGYLLEFLKNRGLSITLPAISAKSIDLRRPRSDLMTKLQWLANSVRPSVQQLVGAGEIQTVLAALGLDHVVHH